MKKSIQRAILLTAIIMLVGGLSSVATASPQEEIKLRWAFAGPPKGVLANSTKWMAEEITKRTEGKIKFQIFWSGSLLGFKDIIHGVSKGTAHLGTASGMFTISEHPHWSTLGLPGTGSDLWALIKAAHDTMHNNPAIMAEFSKLNLVPTYGYVPGTIIYVFKKKATTLAEMKGQRIRGYGAPLCKMLGDLGMVPVVMPIFGVYESMGRGVIDAAVGTPQFMNALKWYEVAKYVVAPKNGNSAADVTTVFNKTTWDSLTPDTRKVISEVTSEFQNKYVQALIESEAAQEKAMETKHGVSFDQLSPDAEADFTAAAKNAREGWFEKWDSKGIKTREVYEQFMRNLAEYNKVVKDRGYPWTR